MANEKMIKILEVDKLLINVQLWNLALQGEGGHESGAPSAKDGYRSNLCREHVGEMYRTCASRCNAGMPVRIYGKIALERPLVG
jgi:hypothetical protein